MTKIRTHKSLYFLSFSYNRTTVDVWFRTLSYRELIILEQLQFADKYGMSLLKACEFAITKIETFNGKELQIKDLSPDIVKETGTKIIELSEVTQEELDKLKHTIEIHLDSQFKADTWNCDVCQKRKLDRVRNCGYRGELNKNRNFKLIVNGEVYRHCPIYNTDKLLLTDAIEAYNTYDNKTLPDEGGLFDQTKFFNLAATLVKHKINEEQEKEIEAMRRESVSPQQTP